MKEVFEGKSGKPPVIIKVRKKRSEFTVQN